MSTTKNSPHWDHMVYHLFSQALQRESTSNTSPISGEAYTVTYLLPESVIYKAKRYEKKSSSEGPTNTKV
jgi:hypothetical protein